MDKKKYNNMLDEYYDIYGWDKKVVFQQKTLIDLGLAEVANDLDKIGKLGKS